MKFTTKSDEREPWLKRRAYRHFDAPLPRHVLRSHVESPRHVERHAFFPLIRHVLERRRFRRGKLVEPKRRPVYYASHEDAAIYARYAAALGERYEAMLRAEGLGSVPTAYRRLDGRCNFHFAREAFDEVRRRDECAVLCFDVKHFFESIEPRRLKAMWCAALDADTLPLDHYRVFREVTAAAFVDRAELADALGLSARAFRREASTPLCSAREFRDRVRGGRLVQRWESNVGIPQGVPISAVLSNLYMLPFDRAVAAWAQSVGGFYRRYSDDILLVVPRAMGARAEEVVREHAQERALTLHEDKTERVFFRRTDDGLRGEPGGGSAVQYLGLTFDGRSVRLRCSTLARNQQRMRRAVRGAVIAARVSGNGRGVFRRALYARFTHLGKGRTAIRYALRVARELGERSIRRQVAGSVAQVKRAIAYFEALPSHRTR